MIATDSPVKTLQELLRPELQEVDEVIVSRLKSPLTLIEEVCRHLIFAGGKRLRPLLTLACAKMFSNDITRAIPLAATVEFIHTATLLHDDVVDESDLRRGQQTANALWGNKISILMGDFLFTQAFALMVNDGDLRVLSLLCEVAQQLAEGEIRQIQHCMTLETTINDLLKVSESKTAALFGASCRVGGYAVGQDLPALQQFGEALGMIFQMVDDIEDYTANNRGKTQGDDFFAGKITLPVVLAYQQGSVQERAFWERTIMRRDTRPEDLPMALALLEPYWDQLGDFASSYADKAFKALTDFPKHEFKDVLESLVHELIQRAVKHTSSYAHVKPS